MQEPVALADVDPHLRSGRLTMTPSQLDAILELQLAVAWAGEAMTDPPRLGWWRTGASPDRKRSARRGPAHRGSAR